MSAIFKLEPGQEITTTEDKVVKRASLYFMVKQDGKPIEPKGDACVLEDGVRLAVISSCWPLVEPNCLRLQKFGTTSPSDDEQSKALMKLKPKLPRLCKLLARAMTDVAEPPTGTVDLATGSTPKSSSANLEILYKFDDQVVEQVPKTMIKPSRIYFNCQSSNTAALAVGQARGLFVEFGCGNSYYEHENCLHFKHFGWITVGVDAMRAKHGDETIEAAFQDLARNLLTSYPPPADAKTWRLVEQTSLELVTK